MRPKNVSWTWQCRDTTWRGTEQGKRKTESKYRVWVTRDSEIVCDIYFDCLLLPNGSPYNMHLSFPFGGGYVDKRPYSTEFSLPSPITNKRPHYVTSSFSSPVTTGYLKMTVPALSLAHVGFEFKDILDFSFIFVRNLFKWKIHRSLRFTYFNGWNQKKRNKRAPFHSALKIQVL